MPIERQRGSRLPALVVLCFVQFMLVLDDNVVSVALPSIKSELGFSTAGLAWVVNAYFLAFGGLLILFGRMADLLGRRRVFLAGVVLFGAASLLCGLAREPWQLVAGRFVQGAGSAMASPAAMSLLTLLFPGVRERARAIGIWGGVAALGAISGLVISGVLTGLTGWRWVFFINLPVALVALVLVPRLLDESRASRGGRLDVPGAVLGTGAVLSLVYALLRAGETQWTDATVLAALGSALALAVAFVVVESRTAEPLLPLAFVSVRVRAVGNGLTLVFSAAMYAMAFLLMIHLQMVLDYEPLTAGIAYLPYGAAILSGMWLSARVVERFGLRRTLIASFLVTAAGLLLLSGVDASDGYLAGVLPGMLVTALGNGLSLPALSVAAVTGTTGENAGLGSAVFSSVQQIGGAVGVSVLVTLAARQSAAAAQAGPATAATEGFSFALVVAAALLAVAAIVIPDLRERSCASSRPSTLRR
ncbi:MFS transporter [Stackebrandtia nassauensis]|uniref:Drug resistance transporter, EmrB/QacA subfamily n=1 Tax=Stackebrandtia nassauensis (strain DSM 44728 / CIP 108903 / NRRL B-16338 / NBRC 102104 / LLR-40K-21) TaxID=446470 RepID=D3PWY0_STANL|nr:MFS transporter [Stackebrandtia nassauensis]ADD45204.1 drug resistance transporter, EmrB/QacA subfamily [Stackebrandtia nassauensis DSM 44728]